MAMKRLSNSAEPMRGQPVKKPNDSPAPIPTQVPREIETKEIKDYEIKRCERALTDLLSLPLHNLEFTVARLRTTRVRASSLPRILKDLLRLRQVSSDLIADILARGGPCYRQIRDSE